MIICMRLVSLLDSVDEAVELLESDVVELLVLLPELDELLELAESMGGGGGGGMSLTFLVLAESLELLVLVEPVEPLELEESLGGGGGGMLPILMLSYWLFRSLANCCKPLVNSAWVTLPSPLLSSWLKISLALVLVLLEDEPVELLLDELVESSADWRSLSVK
jgi:hypothetical protein